MGKSAIKLSKEENKIMNSLLWSFVWRILLYTITFGVLLVVVYGEQLTPGSLQFLAILAIDIILAYIVGFIIINMIIKSKIKKDIFLLMDGVTSAQLIKSVSKRWLLITLLVQISMIIVLVMFDIENSPSVLMPFLMALIFQYSCVSYHNKLFNLSSKAM